jgi:hypothetical protein
VPESRRVIRSKVKECVARCLAAPLPLAALAQFLEELKAAGWETDEIRAVELAAVKILARLMGSGDESNGSSN